MEGPTSKKERKEMSLNRLTRAPVNLNGLPSAQSHLTRTREIHYQRDREREREETEREFEEELLRRVHRY